MTTTYRIGSRVAGLSSGACPRHFTGYIESVQRDYIEIRLATCNVIMPIARREFERRITLPLRDRMRLQCLNVHLQEHTT